MHCHQNHAGVSMMVKTHVLYLRHTHMIYQYTKHVYDNTNIFYGLAYGRWWIAALANH